jgi:hypothetical protein
MASRFVPFDPANCFGQSLSPIKATTEHVPVTVEWTADKLIEIREMIRVGTQTAPHGHYDRYEDEP